MKKSAILPSLLLFVSLLFINTAHSQNPLLRFPDISGELVVFVSGEDIWSVPVEGGAATPLTIHAGGKRYPKFPPARDPPPVSGDYDGNPDVYVMNKYGGEITRVTYYPGYDEVIGWHPTKNKIIFAASRSDYPRYSELFLINPDGTGMEKLIMHEAARGSF